MIRSLIILLAAVFLMSCNTPAASHLSLPKDAVAVIYCDYIILPATVNGINGNFVLDTGADNLHLDEMFFSDNKFPVKNYATGRISGIGNSVQKLTLIKDTLNLQFNKLSYPASNVLVHSLKPIGGDIIDGLIGLDYFSKKVLEINYLYPYIKIYPSAESANLKGYNFIPFLIIDKRKCIPGAIKINDTVTINGNFMIDVGSTSSSITSSVAEKYNLDGIITHKVSYSLKYGGVGGYTYGSDFIAPAVNISGFEFQNVVMSYSSDTAGVLSSENFLGILGNDILSRFDVLFDFRNSNLYLKPNSQAGDPFEPDRLGFSFVERNKSMGGWIVSGLTKDSPAEKAGLRIDDKIISVNNTPVISLTCNGIKEFFRNKDKADLVVDREGKNLNISFPLFPLL